VLSVRLLTARLALVTCKTNHSPGQLPQPITKFGENQRDWRRSLTSVIGGSHTSAIGPIGGSRTSAIASVFFLYFFPLRGPTYQGRGCREVRLRGVPLPHSHGTLVATSCRRLLSCVPPQEGQAGVQGPPRNSKSWHVVYLVRLFTPSPPPSCLFGPGDLRIIIYLRKPALGVLRPHSHGTPAVPSCRRPLLSCVAAPAGRRRVAASQARAGGEWVLGWFVQW
jgi:hypothetical protein